MNDPKLLFIVVGPSGAGKSSFLDKIVLDCPEIVDTITNTTRPMRHGEVQGNPYDFVSDAEFRRRISEDQYVEWAEVHGNLYGTPKSEICRIQELGKTPIMDVDIQGAMNFKRLYPSAVSFFILPPSIDALRQRVVARDKGSMTAEAIDLRMKNAQDEIDQAKKFDHQIINDEFDKAFQEFKKIVENYLKRG